MILSEELYFLCQSSICSFAPWWAYRFVFSVSLLIVIVIGVVVVNVCLHAPSQRCQHVLFVCSCIKCFIWFNFRTKLFSLVYEMNFRKNKSFRPRERPKKGLKNLQTVKTLSAGQNLLNSTTIKTRKQPLTVTAQFQNSLTALMDTLNQVSIHYHLCITTFNGLKIQLKHLRRFQFQANPFFIRCIKSNSEKIPNKFDEPTVVRQVSWFYFDIAIEFSWF